MADRTETTAEERLCDLLDYAQVAIGGIMVDLPYEFWHLQRRLTAIRAQMIAIDMELLWDPIASLPLMYNDIYQAALAGDPGPHDLEHGRSPGISKTWH